MTTTINVRTISEGKITMNTTTFDKPFADITPSEIMSRLNCSIVGWTEIDYEI